MTWQITCNGSTKLATEHHLDVKRNTPRVDLECDGIEFQVEFENRSDYMAARDSSVSRQVIVISKSRKNRMKGEAVKNKEI